MYKGIKLSCSLQSSLSLKTEHDAENMAAAKFRLQYMDYSGYKGHLTGILPLFFLFTEIIFYGD